MRVLSVYERYFARLIYGVFAFILFAMGIVSVGLIGVPVLAGSSAYALAEAICASFCGCPMLLRS